MVAMTVTAVGLGFIFIPRAGLVGLRKDEGGDQGRGSDQAIQVRCVCVEDVASVRSGVLCDKGWGTERGKERGGGREGRKEWVNESQGVGDQAGGENDTR